MRLVGALILGSILGACTSTVVAPPDEVQPVEVPPGVVPAGPPACPDSLPAQESDCDVAVNDQVCSYADTPCDATVRCVENWLFDGVHEDVTMTWAYVPPPEGAVCDTVYETCEFVSQLDDEGLEPIYAVSTLVCTDDGWAVAYGSDYYNWYDDCPTALPEAGQSCAGTYDHCGYGIATECGVEMATIRCENEAWVIDVPPC
jgi:hypothetical protein